jgi:hypothetical protein
MDAHLRIVALIGTVGLLLVVLELVRRRRLLERYALVWLGSAAALVALSAWSGLLGGAIGIAYPPSALFAAAFFFVIALLLHFSVAVSRLADQNKILAQRLAATEQKLGRLEAAVGSAHDRRAEQRPDHIPQEVP